MGNVSYQKMNALYERLKGKPFSTELFEGTVCGFHFKWDDSDFESIIIAVTKNKNGLLNGINYFVNGDVYKERGQLGYQFIEMDEII